ncbi:LacI family DNA-binding transcriptional regulator [Glycomyces paridis]|uniref:LacI family transcriptional regulator n=1 Tax=Glycomyces paridis TaxID=2126555 RepID=A0A4S8PRH0_9ACTN|nr:LacI family DNA-binding transcriptional regulator [Glycomyces paridis]THV30824.1 LacI family transcriptional regulator [Glycomyces paridis]
MATDASRRATLSDIARAAGVSVGTASKALNDRFDVNPETRARVVRVAAELNFRPNALARGLLAGRTRSVGVLTSDLSGRFAPMIVVGVENALGAEESSVLLSITRGEPALERHYVRGFIERRVDGILVVGSSPDPRAPVQGMEGTPAVYVYAPSSSPEDASVVADNVAAGALAAEHLLEQGRRSVFVLSGPPEAAAARDRAEGVRAALAAAGAPLTPLQTLYGDWTEQWGWDAVGGVLASGAEADGFVCGDDQIARGAVDRLLAEGVAVPEEAGVVGFDNWDVLAEYGRHPITSVDMELAEIGARAARMLTSGGPAAGVVAHPGRVVARWSTLGRAKD